MGLQVAKRDIRIQTPVEVASIAGIVAVFVFVELNFQLFTLAGEGLFDAAPFLRNYSTAALGGGWLGLCIYSLRRRRQVQEEMSARISVEEDYELQRITDPVTGLPNRHGFELVLGMRLTEQAGEPVTIMSTEICNLDTITAVHGGQTAQAIEVRVARRLADLLSETDFIARGDQGVFYVLTAGLDADSNRFRADTIIETMTDQASSGIEVGAMALQAYVTFGLLEVDGGHAGEWSADDILRRVDFARHKAKLRGHEAVEVYSESMETALHERAEVEATLAQAIRDGEIVPYFQPLIDLNTRRVSGLEVLARWQHPERGEISPTVFIPIAEDIGLLRTLTLSILRQACVAAGAWPEDVKLAINISPTELREPAAMDRFMAILHETGMDARRIEVEITENAFIEEAGSIASAIATMKTEGISISIDDFGTGYSSLHHLRILPFDKIKIDQSFVRDMATNPESKAIVESIIAMANSLGLKTTAEGIEAGPNEGMLQELGCSVGQGYLYAKPLPQSEVAAFLDNYYSQLADTQDRLERRRNLRAIA